jgi:hypothetical protein
MKLTRKLLLNPQVDQSLDRYATRLRLFFKSAEKIVGCSSDKHSSPFRFVLEPHNLRVVIRNAVGIPEFRRLLDGIVVPLSLQTSRALTPLFTKNTGLPGCLQRGYVARPDFLDSHFHFAAGTACALSTGQPTKKVHSTGIFVILCI